MRDLSGSPHACAVLLTDYTMPGMTGLALAAACRQWRPALPVILCTSEDPAVYAAQAAQRITAVLAKPFRPEELTGLLRRVLASQEPAEASAVSGPKG